MNIDCILTLPPYFCNEGSTIYIIMSFISITIANQNYSKQEISDFCRVSSTLISLPHPKMSYIYKHYF